MNARSFQGGAGISFDTLYVNIEVVGLCELVQVCFSCLQASRVDRASADNGNLTVHFRGYVSWEEAQDQLLSRERWRRHTNSRIQGLVAATSRRRLRVLAVRGKGNVLHQPLAFERDGRLRLLANIGSW